MDEAFIFILVFLVVVGVPLTALVLAIVALARSRHIGDLRRRIDWLETRLREPGPARLPDRFAPEAVEAEPVEVELAEVVPVAEPAMPAPRPARPPIQWELLIGRRALGWVAVVLLIFAATFFLRYAIENEWIGPLGRVAVGAITGIGLMLGGWRYDGRGWRVFSRMLSSAGVVILYLSVYSAFGFYRLLPQSAATAFMAVVVIESAILAVRYNSLAIALTAVLGGLFTPVLMQSEHDRYVELFTYLAVLDLGVLLLMLCRRWPAVGSVALLGTQALFWMWYDGNYHPEKLWWALGFQAVVYFLFLAQNLSAHVLRQRRAGWEELGRLVLGALFGFLAVYVLLKEDFEIWMGTAALVAAVWYTVIARLMLAVKPSDSRQLLTALAIATGFIALALPIQADAAWVAMGWAAQAAALWWFGQRIEAPPLRVMATALAAGAVFHVVMIDLPDRSPDLLVPVFNAFALPALGATFCLLAAVLVTRPFLARLAAGERVLVAIAGLGTVLLLWLLLSVECYGFFDARSRLPDADRTDWRWMGQLSLSILWGVFAMALLTVGFATRLARLRWLAIALFGLTVAKVFFVDMANLDQIYRIAAFFALAIILGIAAWAYQFLRPESKPADQAQGVSHDVL